MNDPVHPRPSRPVPPGSTLRRQLAHAINGSLTLSGPASQKDELTYLRLSRDRVRLVQYACKRLLADREAGDCDIMAIAVALRDEAAQLCDDAYDHHPAPS
jgi:hypothetical protein